MIIRLVYYIFLYILSFIILCIIHNNFISFIIVCFIVKYLYYSVSTGSSGSSKGLGGQGLRPGQGHQGNKDYFGQGHQGAKDYYGPHNWAVKGGVNDLSDEYVEVTGINEDNSMLVGKKKQMSEGAELANCQD